MQNSASAKYKFSRLELLTNKMLMIIFMLQIILAVIAGVQGTNWILDSNIQTPGCSYLHPNPPTKCSNAYYMDFNGTETDKTFGYWFIRKFFTWILIFTNFVPISLMVTLEIVKFWQAMAMSYEVMMYDEE